MERGLYIAASGMLAQTRRQDQLANDLANGSTPGYKPDRSTVRSFGELLLSNRASGAVVGPLGLGVEVDRTVTSLAPAPIRDTGQPLDFAIEGDGWFAVRTPRGVRFTRNGQFTLDGRGFLVDQLGNPVLGQGGRPVRAKADGTVDPARIGVFAATGLRKQGDNYFTGAAAGRAPGSVRGGALEASGVDPARTMIDMIASFRVFEAGQKAIRTIDETLGKAANQVGSTSG
ncbi:MAG: flagellar hook-basal body protein [Thermoleophilaceae bacterium]|nr:flagellar hook-basal body protein [Thermoleophilaceae bacterium]